MALKFKKNSASAAGQSGRFHYDRIDVFGRAVHCDWRSSFRSFQPTLSAFYATQNLTGPEYHHAQAVAQCNGHRERGTGYYPGTNFPNWPIGITIQNIPRATRLYIRDAHGTRRRAFDTLPCSPWNPTTPPTIPATSAPTSYTQPVRYYFANPARRE